MIPVSQLHAIDGQNAAGTYSTVSYNIAISIGSGRPHSTREGH